MLTDRNPTCAGQTGMILCAMVHHMLSSADILAPGAQIHLARAKLENTRPAALHSHDFFELLWVQNGKLRHHLPGRTQDFGEGTLFFLRPSDHHALQGRSDEALVVSVTLHADLINSLATRHPSLRGRLFWATAPDPVILRRDSHQLAALNQAALSLERSRRDALAAEAFLLPLCHELIDGQTDLPADAPAWLAAACAAARDPRVFVDGAAGFARIAGRAHPHVSRTTRRFLGQSPSDYINTQRMGFAARRLSGSGDTLAEIAQDCGIPNLSHFHKLFRAHHGLTPAQYRRQFQKTVVQPG
jgi:AraC family transcriptional regulator, dual regulator of chb operon